MDLHICTCNLYIPCILMYVCVNNCRHAKVCDIHIYMVWKCNSGSKPLFYSCSNCREVVADKVGFSPPRRLLFWRQRQEVPGKRLQSKRSCCGIPQVPFVRGPDPDCAWNFRGRRTRQDHQVTGIREKNRAGSGARATPGESFPSCKVFEEFKKSPRWRRKMRRRRSWAMWQHCGGRRQ